jgi:hypothetical protein
MRSGRLRRYRDVAQEEWLCFPAALADSRSQQVQVLPSTGENGEHRGAQVVNEKRVIAAATDSGTRRWE